MATLARDPAFDQRGKRIHHRLRARDILFHRRLHADATNGGHDRRRHQTDVDIGAKRTGLTAALQNAREPPPPGSIDVGRLAFRSVLRLATRMPLLKDLLFRRPTLAAF